MQLILKKTLLSKAVFGLMLLPTNTTFADENVTELPKITVVATNNLDHANGYLKNEIYLGALGQKKIIDTPFSVQAYTDKFIQEKQASTLGDVLTNDPSIVSITNSGHLEEGFQIRGSSVGAEEIAINGFYGVAPQSRVPAEIIGSVSIVKGPNALVAGMSPLGGVGGVVNVVPKKADVNLTRLSSTFEDKGYYQSHFDIARRFGENEQFGIRSNLVYGQGERGVDGQDDRKAIGSISADYKGDQLEVALLHKGLKGRATLSEPNLSGNLGMRTP